MTYTAILRQRIERREISFSQGVDFLTEHGIHELKAIRLLTGAAQ